jgi:valyl-tRNA synthetase
VTSDAGGRNDAELFDRIFPMDMRSQGHDIIRTWLFATVVRSHFEHDSVPWDNAAINGWILDPDRKKMSKSKGNVVTPEDVLKQHSSDAVRYWALSGRLGSDSAYDDGQMKVGRRLAIKILNASKFALSFGDVTADGDDLAARVTHPLDRSMLAALADVVDQAGASFESWDYTRSLEVTESFFWSFCDNYLELVKDRAYGGQGDEAAASARAALRVALDVLLRLLSPFLPYATEEVWSWWHQGSVHRSPWPESSGLRAATGDADKALLDTVGLALAGVRKVKSEAKVGMKSEITSMVLAAPSAQVEQVRVAEADLAATGHVTAISYAEADQLEVRDVQLVPYVKH